MKPTNGELRQHVLRALDLGRLPTRRPDFIWGGRSAGSQCAICDASIASGQVELEFELRANGNGGATYHLHPECFAAWECDGRGHEPVRPAWSDGQDTITARSDGARRG